MSKLIKITASVTILLLLGSCVIFKGGNVEKVDFSQLNSTSNQKKKIYVRWDFDFLPIGHSSLTYEDRERLFEKVLNESNCCELVKKKTEADLIFEGKAYDQRNSARLVGFMASVVTAYIIPSWHTAKIFVTVDVKDGKNTRHYEAIDSMTTAIWLPLIVATPFAYDFDKTQKEILENSYRSLLVQIKNDSFFSKK